MNRKKLVEVFGFSDRTLFLGAAYAQYADRDRNGWEWTDVQSPTLGDDIHDNLNTKRGIMFYRQRY